MVAVVWLVLLIWYLLSYDLKGRNRPETSSCHILRPQSVSVVVAVIKPNWLSSFFFSAWRFLCQRPQGMTSSVTRFWCPRCWSASRSSLCSSIGYYRCRLSPPFIGFSALFFTCLCFQIYLFYLLDYRKVCNAIYFPCIMQYYTNDSILKVA